MNKAILFNFLIDREKREIHVDREFNAPLGLVWKAWTDPGILDHWWAPKPWKAETKSMSFQKGGNWHYCMVGPKDERHWCLFDYQEVRREKYFSGREAFCDENAVITETMPVMQWTNDFREQQNGTMVKIVIGFDRLTDLETIIQMGFREGFTMGLENLDQYLEAQAQAK